MPKPTSNPSTKVQSLNPAIIASILKLKEIWPSAIVARDEIDKFSGGLLTPRNMSNLDSRGEGPLLKIKFRGRKVAYPIDSLIDWIIDQVA
jgi:hypothetical protein